MPFPSSPVVLAIDTSSAPLSLALRVREGGSLSFHKILSKPHDETMLPRVRSLLARARLGLRDLDAVAVASGPGAFTGIRIGMSYAAVLSSRLGIPALAISRLEALAFKAADGKRMLAAIEGWRSERYCQLFSGRSRAPAPVGKPLWVRAEDWPKVRGSAQEARVIEAETRAIDLLAPALRRLPAGKIPTFKPLYLKPASFERLRGAPR